VKDLRVFGEALQNIALTKIISHSNVFVHASMRTTDKALIVKRAQARQKLC